VSKKPTVLVVDDEPDIRELVQVTLGRMDLESVAAANVAEAHGALAGQRFDLCLTDMQLPDGDGIKLVQHIQNTQPDLPVAVITAHGSVDLAVEALKAGAFDFVAKPVRLEDLRNLVSTALKVLPASEEVSDTTLKLLGKSDAIENIRQIITRLARSQAPVYIGGESGTGKELVARLIHEQGPRAEAGFIPVNCGAIPAELMESEFFGHKRGSFTGATSDKQGLFQAANGGTLFLDEVADLPLGMQVKLLRAIQEKAVRAVGAREESPVDVRILSATHKDVSALVDSGDFRQDLFYRLNVIEVDLPPLRERPVDIPLLAEHMLDKLCTRTRREPAELTPEALEILSAYEFPGNVRELENILERSLTLCDGLYISPSELILPSASRPAAPAGTHSDENGDDVMADGSVSAHGIGSASANQQSQDFVPGSETLDDYVDRLESEAISKALAETGGNKTRAAKLLGITFRALRYKLEKLDLR